MRPDNIVPAQEDLVFMIKYHVLRHLTLVATQPWQSEMVLVSINLGLGKDNNFTKSPTHLKTCDIHGCQAMIDLMQTMESMNDFNNDMFYGWITTWLDSFLQSHVKQNMNNVWMYAITLPKMHCCRTTHIVLPLDRVIWMIDLTSHHLSWEPSTDGYEDQEMPWSIIRGTVFTLATFRGHL